MKGRYPRVLIATLSLQPGAHFICGLVREGNGSDMLRFEMVFFDQKSDLFRNDARLTATRTRYYQ
jgi:hypothetical protein